MKELINRLDNINKDINKLNLKLKKYERTKVLVTSDYNGQEFGTSNKNIKGEIKEISSIYYADGNVFLSLVGYEYGCPHLSKEMVKFL